MEFIPCYHACENEAIVEVFHNLTQPNGFPSEKINIHIWLAYTLAATLFYICKYTYFLFQMYCVGVLRSDQLYLHVLQSQL